MATSPFRYFISLFLLLLCFEACLRVGDAKAGCIERERQALLHFKKGVLDDYGLLSSWGNAEDKRDCCKWRGVECDNQTGHVIMLDLHGTGQDGMGDFQILGGRISQLGPSLAELQHLKHLNLSWNDFEGNLPTQLGNLSNLQSLDLGYNSDMTCGNLDWLSHLPSLTHLDLRWVSLSKAIHWPQAINKMPSLTELYLSGTQLPPIIPTISISHINSSASLAVLDLSENDLTSSIYPWSFNFSTSLAHLDLSYNDLNGSIPDAFGNMTSLAYLDLSWNELRGSIPDAFGDMTTLAYLHLSSNKLRGSILDAFGNMTTLAHLDLSYNDLNGSIPDAFGNMTTLAYLDLSSNQLRGSIPDAFGNMTTLAYLDLSVNELRGSIPDAFGDMTTLAYLDLSSNQLEGKITTWMGGSLSDLIVLNLRSNEFNGSIPSSLCQLKQIQMLDLSSNNLSGKIPKCLKNLTAMAQKRSPVLSYETYYNLSIQHYYVDSTLVQWKGKEQEYKKTLRFIKSIDFSRNKLIGEIPIEVTDLVELVSLNLSRNNLIGSIPTTIGQLKLLDVLDLSQNQLNGRIPDTLSQIADLSVLDLSNNTLSGKIPLGTQLQSFDASTYEGNPELCGPPLLKRCPEDELGGVSFTSGLSSKKEDIQDDANNIWFYGNIVLGFIIGFWGVCGTLLFNSSWRYAYFQLLSKIKDWLYVITIVNMNRIRRSLQG
ncbi:receptor-like protein EIX1 [Vitis riparia]|uniref:receptor-like protein EIX1 n=1 Tax=Vitis riparia TaxID=96939 RepID=UPI00155AAA44|nr:receptor-like protein EIX1 [Vitis riparia]